MFDETYANMSTLGRDPLTAVNLNLPSVNVPTMPGTVTVKRTAKNVSNRNVTFTVRTTSPSGSRIQVSPTSGRIRPGESLTFTVKITSNAPEGQYFGQIDLRPAQGPDLHLPVAFYNRQGDVTLSQACNPASVAVRATTTCTVTAQNNSARTPPSSARRPSATGCGSSGATGADVNRRGDSATAGPVILAARKEVEPAIRR